MSHSHPQFWRAREVPPGKTCLWRLGGLRLWMQRNEPGWRIAREMGTSFDQMNVSLVPNDVAPSELEWQTIAWAGKGNHFLMRPEPPDRPVVARPEERVIVPGGERVSYYCLMPCWVRFHLGESASGNGLLRLPPWPTRPLSDTWFGDHAAGVLSYALAFPAGRVWSELPIGPHHILVPVRIENDSLEPLAFERLCLRPQYLGIYAAGPVLWASAVEVRYHGPQRASSLLYETRAPVEAHAATLVTEPAERASRSLAGFTFASPSPSDFRSRLA
jgi:hypothetical protein